MCLELNILRQNERMKWPTAVDLFSGAGGLTEGLKRARFRVIGAVEIDSVAVDSYRKNHPKTRVWGEDIWDLDAADVRRSLGLRKGQLDLLAGCPPCEGFSRLRTKNGRRRPRDERNDLLFEFLRFVEEFKPKAIMLENVPGLARNYRFREFTRSLRDLGYQLNYSVLNAADYGVPQRRRRLILLAARRFRVPFASSSEDGPTVRDAFTGLARAGRSGDPLHDFPENRSEKVRGLINRIPRNGGSRKDLGRRRQLKCHRTFDGFKDVYGRMAWNEVAPTITSGCVNPSKGRFLHPSCNRAITLREAALLQGFRPDYYFSLSGGKYRAAAMIGDALPPEFIKRHALEVRRLLRPLKARQ